MTKFISLEQKSENFDLLTKISKFVFYNQLCHFCNLQLTSDSELSDHFYSKHEPLSVVTDAGRHEYSCRLCAKQFAQYPAAVKHCRVKTIEPYQCPDCKTTISHPHNIARHKKRCTGDESFFCSKCQQIIKYKPNFDKHFLRCQVKKHAHVKHAPVPEEGQAYINCNFCDYKSVYSHIVKKHMTMSHSVDGEVFKCNKCDRDFHSKSGVRKHKAYVHSQVSLFSGSIK